MSDELRDGPLTGIKVLDLGRHLAGPTAAMWLGDLGADVIKIENPVHGEDSRASGPPFYNGESAFFLAANRNKRSLAMEFKTATGQEVFRKLASTADVVVENFRPGVMEALNIGYEQVAETNPGIIYCSISGFGADGPFADRPGLDQIIQGFSGLMSITGFEGGEPVRSGLPIADLLTGLFGAYGVLAALQARERTGRGQKVDLSLLESMVGMLAFQATRYLNGGDIPPPAGNHHPINAPYGVFKTKDGYVTIGATGDKRFPKMCEVLGVPEWIEDERFKTNGGRFAHRYELAEMIGEQLQSKTSDEWEVIMNQAGIPCGPIYDVGQALDHPQVRHRQMVAEVEHPTAGMLRLLGLPVKFSHTPGDVRLAPPMHGQHTAEVLREAGYSDAEIAGLKAQGVVSTGASAGEHGPIA